MNKEEMLYCPTNSEYGWVEAQFKTEAEAEAWIEQQKTNYPEMLEFNDEPYHISTYTQAELDALPED